MSEQLKARYNIDAKWRDAWGNLAANGFKDGRPRLQTQCEYIQERAALANHRIKLLMDEYDLLTRTPSPSADKVVAFEDWFAAQVEGLTDCDCDELKYISKEAFFASQRTLSAEKVIAAATVIASEHPAIFSDSVNKLVNALAVYQKESE